MSFWVDPDRVPHWAWITAFILIPAFLNFLRVRRFGELEFGLTAIKLATIVGLIVLGVILPWGVSAGNRKLGYTPYNSTDSNFVPSNELLSCPDPLNPPPGIQCLPSPGFACIISYIASWTDYRLGTGSVPSSLLFRWFRSISRFLGGLLSSHLCVPWSRAHWNCCRRDRTTAWDSPSCCSSSFLSHHHLLRGRRIRSRIERFCPGSIPSVRSFEPRRRLRAPVCLDGSASGNSGFTTYYQCYWSACCTDSCECRNIR